MRSAQMVLDPVDVLYIAALLGDRRRPIDAYIDYFGGGRTERGVLARASGPANRKSA